MGVTKFDKLNATTGTAKIIAAGSGLPTTPEAYYGINRGDVDSCIWTGGELAFRLDDAYHGTFYVQTQVGGRTAVWVRLLEKLETSTSTTTSSSTTTTSSTSSSTTTSTTSSSTSSSTTTSSSTSSTTTSSTTSSSTSSSTTTSSSSSSTTTS